MGWLILRLCVTPKRSCFHRELIFLAIYSIVFKIYIVESCEKHPVFKHLVEECNAGYSWSVEQQENYSPGWNEELNKTMRYRARRGKRKALYLGLEDPWRYKSKLNFLNLIS